MNACLRASKVRFIVPASMVANLDFVESIFGNGDNPDLAENDAALDPEYVPAFVLGSIL